MDHFIGINSRVHPKYKTKYRVNNRPGYDRALVQRGEITNPLGIVWAAESGGLALRVSAHRAAERPIRWAAGASYSSA
jgi:hypothetical protein